MNSPARGGGRTRRGLALGPKKASKLWIWKALGRATGRLIDWECGGRDAATLERMLSCLPCWRVRLFCTDDWVPYAAALPVGCHYIGKDQTQHIASNNARQRHWFARFRRRTCVVSKSVAMVEGDHGPVRLLSLQRRQTRLSVSWVKLSRL